MKTQVYYCTKTNHTRKIAEAIALGAGAEAVNIKSGKKPEKADILFIGGSLYAGVISPKLKEFISSIDGETVKEIVLFGSSASGETPFAQMKEACAEAGIPVSEETFFCPGSFVFVSRGRPNSDDLEAAQKFGAKMTE